ncbi:MAG: hypothetical protein ABSC20_09540 [Candidatus Bathyarchaeia archaeon]|jgi:hypothetical protein
METDKQSSGKRTEFKEREIERMFEGIKDEIAIITANAKFNFTTCKTNEKTLKLTLTYIEDTKKLVDLLQNRISLLIDTTS